VVSNRLSTPVLYGGHLGADLGVYGDALRIDGVSGAQNDRVRETWPELHGEHLDPVVARPLIDRELGVHHLLGPAELERALGWSGLTPTVPAVQFWSTSVVARALVNLRRRAGDPAAAPTPVAAQQAETAEPEGLALGAWLRAATSYLPRPLPRSIPRAGGTVEPIEVGRGHRVA
jgi:hypothetical protein